MHTLYNYNMNYTNEILFTLILRKTNLLNKKEHSLKDIQLSFITILLFLFLQFIIYKNIPFC